ncbi:hypothetical protein Cob_v001352 [Colletotrichum orbiculare MAFF 240422]|uniref:Uncharacterized protein n=1 Tax=Colletotrichum orbiculare (strain 104-T / ATCC 96160 / CBS 514.97 / LARS 414 / MAFF 240422) TaxID=1213857 RepID=A0A484G6W3_COLOR|nr:hypothetical protein Cob_v001352 [Colletotrichum orbiculare MAFF 240422]
MKKALLDLPPRQSGPAPATVSLAATTSRGHESLAKPSCLPLDAIRHRFTAAKDSTMSAIPVGCAMNLAGYCSTKPRSITTALTWCRAAGQKFARFSAYGNCMNGVLQGYSARSPGLIERHTVDQLLGLKRVSRQ